jgi:RNA polymerase subunit RPABC4/transcription elongation factor Spt4
MIFCPKCNELNGDSRNTCWSCNASLGLGSTSQQSAYKKICPNCKSVYTAKKDTCENCSSTLSVYDPTAVIYSPKKGMDIKKIQIIACSLVAIFLLFVGLNGRKNIDSTGSDSAYSSSYTSETSTEEASYEETEANEEASKSAGITSAIMRFINSDAQYGVVEKIKNMSNWAYGERREVITDTGSYLFNMKDNDVVGVWKYHINGSREQIFSKDVTSNVEENIERDKTDDLPRYTILFKNTKIGTSEYFADVLIPSFTKTTSKEKRELAFKKIMEKENFLQASFYNKEEAYKANMSESFLKSHPNALKNGFLGSVDEYGTFTPGEFLYP